MTTDPTATRLPHAPDVGFVSRGSVFALCSCGALQIVDPAHTRHARSWLQERGWSRPPTNLADPDDGWFCPACTTRTDTTPLAVVVTVDRHVELLDARLAEVQAERDAARRDLARIVQLCVHLYTDAVQAVRELVEERAEDSREIVLLHRLCAEAAEMLNEPTATGGDAMDAMADRLRAAAADEKPPRPICGAVVRERVTGTMTARTLCPLPPGHDGYHAEALAGDDTDTDRSAP